MGTIKDRNGMDPAETNRKIYILLKTNCKDFPNGPVIKNPPANTEDTDSIPGRGGFHPRT